MWTEAVWRLSQVINYEKAIAAYAIATLAALFLLAFSVLTLRLSKWVDKRQKGRA